MYCVIHSLFIDVFILFGLVHYDHVFMPPEWNSLPWAFVFYKHICFMYIKASN